MAKRAESPTKPWPSGARHQNFGGLVTELVEAAREQGADVRRWLPAVPRVLGQQALTNVCGGLWATQTDEDLVWRLKEDLLERVPASWSIHWPSPAETGACTRPRDSAAAWLSITIRPSGANELSRRADEMWAGISVENLRSEIREAVVAQHAGHGREEADPSIEALLGDPRALDILEESSTAMAVERIALEEAKRIAADLPPLGVRREDARDWAFATSGRLDEGQQRAVDQLLRAREMYGTLRVSSLTRREQPAIVDAIFAALLDGDDLYSGAEAKLGGPPRSGRRPVSKGR